jgi:hypothetical protein
MAGRLFLKAMRTERHFFSGWDRFAGATAADPRMGADEQSLSSFAGNS